ncbi:WecB/TagA/CpsF family glycosyltransferase [Neotabrizicola shimadae]|uniref:WecB/TagA/CpsF family glycosyltransferase n=1 Tax=Neotabrizicola shimadae TaxID=2807096 RepID=UPI002176CF79|nr:WecB/TagA/CpsF family glycosyltransferase [Neotabrizicola shimadae]
MEFRFGSDRVTITHPDRAALLTEVDRRLAAGRGFALATLNLDHMVKLRHDPAFRAAYQRQDIVVADGNPVVWLSRLARRPVSLVPGADLVLPLAEAAARHGVPVALIGSTDVSLNRAAAALKAQVPGLTVACTIAPSFGFDPEGEEAAAILTRLRDENVGLAFIALGAPKQERLAARGRALSPRTGFASIGAGLDFLAGTQHRAPAGFRALSLEWLWRALMQPRRMIPRYMACAAILPGEAARALRQRTG